MSEVVIGETPHRFVQGQFAGERRREAVPHRFPFPDLEPEPRREDTRLCLTIKALAKEAEPQSA